MASILRFDNWQNSDGTSIATTDASGNISFAGAGAGKILQVVRATDVTTRTTTSTSYVDANISVTITPTSATSTILVVWSAYPSTSSGAFTFQQITDSSDVALSGAEESTMGTSGGTAYISNVTIGYAEPATTSATTYKGRWKATAGTGTLNNGAHTGQMIALEISA